MEEKFVNDDTLYYCKDCLSLKIKAYGEDTSFCDDCGSTNIVTSDTFEEWEKKYEERYGHKYLNLKK